MSRLSARRAERQRLRQVLFGEPSLVRIEPGVGSPPLQLESWLRQFFSFSFEVPM
jgi:hypothetical protein